MQRDPGAWIQSIRNAPHEKKAALCEDALKIWPAATEVWQLYFTWAREEDSRGTAAKPPAAEPESASEAEPASASASAADARAEAEAAADNDNDNEMHVDDGGEESPAAAKSTVSKLMERALAESVDPKLYALYIAHVRERKPEQLTEAYEYVLEMVSFDPDSGAIWRQYIDYLAGQNVSNEWEEQFRRDKVRKAYKRAVALPLANVEALWRSYGLFENRISRVSARKFIDERSPAYMKARSCLKTYQQLTQGLSFSTMPSVELSQRDCTKWREYIKFEQSNPLELDTAEHAEEISNRLSFAFKRATICARWAPALWFDAGSTLGVEFWAQGCGAMPESYLLAFKLAEHWEQENDFERVKQTYSTLAAAIAAQRAEDPTPAWAQLVRAAHRMQGADTAREIVKQCISELEEPGIPLYLAAATVESSEEQHAVAKKIMAFAFAKFTSAAPWLSDSSFSFVLRYLHYLFVKSDVVNARSVFEQSISKTPQPLLKRLFDHMLTLETKHSLDTDDGLASVRKLEKRCAELFSVDEAELFAKRFCDDSIFAHDLPQLLGNGAAGSLNGSLGTNTSAGGSSLQRTSSSSTKIKDLVPPDSVLAVMAASLPPPEAYDGPGINVPLLMRFIME